MPTYSVGLGVPFGDTLRSAADTRAEVEIEGRKVALRAWQYTISAYPRPSRAAESPVCDYNIRGIFRSAPRVDLKLSNSRSIFQGPSLIRIRSGAI
jgi:hypothetical protein